MSDFRLTAPGSKRKHLKPLHSVRSLEAYMLRDPELKLYDTAIRKQRYILRRDKTFVSDVDGRSARALWPRLRRSRNGGFELRTP